MSCGYPPTYNPGLELSLEGRIHYPSRCAWSDNSRTYRLVVLIDLRWRHWGKSTAFAHVKLLDNHDMDNNGFQHHRVRVLLSDPRPAVGHSGTTLRCRRGSSVEC